MKVAILTANLGNFDTVVDPVPQNIQLIRGFELAYPYRFTDKDFPPIAGLTPRLQYRIPKLFGWEMKPGYDVYLWLDGSMSLQDPGSLQWFIDQLGDKDAAFFKHPWRKTIKEEVDHIQEKLDIGNEYITSRYGGGLHQEQYKIIVEDPNYVDDVLLTSTAFIYRNTPAVQDMLSSWWFYQSRYFTCDQVVLPYVLAKHNINFNVIQENQFKTQYITLTSHHK